MGLVGIAVLRIEEALLALQSATARHGAGTGTIPGHLSAESLPDRPIGRLID